MYILSAVQLIKCAFIPHSHKLSCFWGPCDASDMSKNLSDRKREFEEVFLTHYQALMNVGMSIKADKEFVKDVIQLFFIEVWEKDLLARDITHLKAYLIRSFYRKMFQQLKKQKGFSERLDHEFKEMDQAALDEFVREETQVDEIQQRLNLAIEQLPEKEREIFRMKYMEGLAYEEIALFTGKSKQTVYNQIHSSIRKLRSSLAGHLLQLRKK